MFDERHAVRSVNIIPSVSAREFWQLARRNRVIDVRSPGEFLCGHIPGAINLPLFSNEERAEVGIAYKAKGRDKAVLIGLKIVGPKLAELVEQAKKLAVDGNILVHCWRGGMRSQSIAEIFAMAGLKPILLSGGYKQFRALAQSHWQRPLKLVVVSGYTGAGKTRVLQKLMAAGQQVADLEQLAHHRGSAFGGIDQPQQPTTEQFENRLFETLSDFDLEKPIWIEDEGSRIGQVVVPSELYQQIRHSPAIQIEVSRERRIQNLLEDYGDSSVEDLEHSIRKISKRLGGLAVKTAIQATHDGHLENAVDLVLEYYDKTYLTAIKSMPRKQTVIVNIDGLDDQELHASLVSSAKSLHPNEMLAGSE